MPETRGVASISRTLLLPSEHQGTIRLRYQLAEDGCKESQVALAKCLLTSPINSVEERNFNAQLAVYWLLQAAKNGQEEAFVLLKDCANAGVGINTRNSFEVEKCLKYSDIEIISRRITFAIFRAIMSDTEDLLSEESFREKIDRILQDDNKEYFTSSLNEGSSQTPEKSTTKQPEDISIQDQPHISFSEVVNSVQTCLEGNVPIVSLKQVTDFGEQKKWLFVKYFSVIWNLIFRATEDFIHSFSSVSVLISVLFMCICFNLVSNFTTPGTEINIFLYNSNLFMVTLLCLLTLFSSTCFVISVSFGVENMQQWLHLIKLFEPNIKSNEVEKKYLMKTAYPLFTFFIVSIIYLTLLPLSSVQNAFTDLGILSAILMFFVDRSISHQRYHVNISLILNALTCLYKSNILQKWSVSILSLLNFDLVYEIGNNYQIHLSFISCLALPFVLPYLYLKMALGNERRGWHLVLLPHLMCVSWMNLACFHLADVDTTNLIFSVSTLLFLLALSRYFGFVITLTLYILIKTIVVSGYLNLHLILMLPVFAVLYFASLLFVRKFQISNENRLCSLVICILVLILSYQAVNPQSINIKDASNAVLPWDKYQTYCHHRAWYRTNPAEVQISCLPFKGRKVSIEGSITAIEVTQIRNSLQSATNILPNPLYDWFVCAFGKKYVSCDTENISAFDKEHCSLYETLNLSSCHLHNWDEYKYEITIEVSTRTSPEIILIADHICSSFVRNLKEGDILRAVGILESNVGGMLPKLRLVKAECSSCYTYVDCNTSVVMPQPNYSLSFKNIIWFYLSPFIQYRTG